MFFIHDTGEKTHEDVDECILFVCALCQMLNIQRKGVLTVMGVKNRMWLHIPPSLLLV